MVHAAEYRRVHERHARLLEELHAVVRLFQVTADHDGPMVRHECGIAVDKPLCDFTRQIDRRRRHIRQAGNAAKQNRRLRQDIVRQVAVSQCKTNSEWRVRMDDGPDIWTEPVDLIVHLAFGRRFAIASQLRAVRIDDDYVIVRHEPLVDTGRRDGDLVPQTNTHVATQGGVHVPVIQSSGYLDQFSCRLHPNLPISSPTASSRVASEAGLSFIEYTIYLQGR